MLIVTGNKYLIHDCANQLLFYYLVTSPLAFGYADVGCFREDDTLRRVTTPTSGFEDFILKPNQIQKMLIIDVFRLNLNTLTDYLE